MPTTYIRTFFQHCIPPTTHKCGGGRDVIYAVSDPRPIPVPPENKTTLLHKTNFTSSTETEIRTSEPFFILLLVLNQAPISPVKTPVHCDAFAVHSHKSSQTTKKKKKKA